MENLIPRYRVAILHASFWCVYLSFNFYRMSSWMLKDSFDLTKLVSLLILQTLIIMSISYLNYFFFLPRWLKHKNFPRYILEFIIPFAFWIAIRIVLDRYFADGYTYTETYLYSTSFIVHVSVISLFIVIFVGMLRFAIGWFEFEAKKKEVENEKLYAELNFLKAQINPHFLFNTLNNLYYLAYSKSPNTTEVISKLSQMMRYMIYDSNHEKVLVSKEIEYMENYISLEKLRLNNEISVTFKVEGDIKSSRITPLIFITFLENAFKHGVSNNNPNCWVNVLIRIEDNDCLYIVENSKVQKSKDSKEGKGGIGLKNVKRRLELSYPEMYSLEVKDLENKYIVNLKLQLN